MASFKRLGPTGKFFLGAYVVPTSAWSMANSVKDIWCVVKEMYEDIPEIPKVAPAFEQSFALFARCTIVAIYLPVIASSLLAMSGIGGPFLFPVHMYWRRRTYLDNGGKK